MSAFAEIISLGAVLPFLSVLLSPERIYRFPAIARAAKACGFDSQSELFLPITVLFISAVLIAGTIRMFLVWASTRLTTSVGAQLSSEVYRRTLYQPYRIHLARNSSEVISSITNKVEIVVQGVIMPLQILALSTVMISAIMLTLMIIDPVVASAATVGFGGSYALITLIARKRLLRNSRFIAEKQTQVIKAMQEGLGGIRDVLLDGTQQVYCDIFHEADLPMRRSIASNSVIGQAPRYLMEALGMILITLLAYGLAQRSGTLAASLPTLGALALGAQRLLPALQQGYGAWVNITGSQVSLEDTLNLLEQPLPPEASQPQPSPLVLKRDIVFEQVRFKYNQDQPWVLDGFDLVIPKGARVGFVGSTGSGKSTTLDLLMGLLDPTEGRILIDDQPLSGELVRAWQRSIAHVPQSIFLSDTTLAENIAFGVPPNRIDLNRVRSAAKQAHIAAFIEAGPEGYQALIGERGIRISGGQRQRIGIARALYKQASVLIFDEATSALDNVTEQSVLEAIEDLDHDLTILLIAHRLTTVRRCDKIVEVDQGRVVASGTYDELLATSASFRRMVSSGMHEVDSSGTSRE